MLKLYAMCCGRLRFDRTLFFPGEAPGEQMTIEVPSYLIRHDRGVVLFDTGVDCFAHHPFDYRIVDGEHDVFGDGSLLLIPTPGHTPGHQSLRVHAAPGVDFLLTADACYSRAHLDREIIPNAGAAWSPELMIETFARLRTLQDRQGCHLIFGHDPEQWATLRHAPEPLH